jgi:phosphoglucosamine mutase
VREAVLAKGADVGVAFDGDADRAMFISKTGHLVDGDAVLLIAARALKRAGRLSQDTVVSTVMANLGLEEALARESIRMLRTAVGDKYVLEEMIRSGAVLGGEQSGHIIFHELATTGDGLLTALQVLEISRLAGLGLDELVSGMQLYPQKLVNIRVKEKKPLEDLGSVQAAIRECERELDGAGRILVRFSGTEPLARVMVEAPEAAQVEGFTARIAAAIERELGSGV